MRLLFGLLFLLCACRSMQPARVVECELLIVGGSFGGCAAALGAAGRDVWLVEESDWIGGQVTSQGVSALDEHKYIESFGGTRAYCQFREGVRARSGGKKNPGGGWVSRLCFLPRTGLAQLEQMLQAAGTHVLLEARPVEAVVESGRVVSVSVRDRAGQEIEFHPRFVLDATDTGELLPLVGAPYSLGTEARAETGEPHAAEVADPRRQQSFTYPFALEFRPGESHVIEKPAGYEELRDAQPYTLAITSASGKPVRFGFFEKGEGSGPFWTYRRIAPEIALINWPGNDSRLKPLSESDGSEAKRLALGFLYWLQTECPRDEGGHGYPELLLRKDVMGSEDGLSKRPYVREGRRLKARTIVREQDLTTSEARARAFDDSVGLGWYPIDVHARAGERDGGGLALPTRPFQIPLSALLPRELDNFVVAGKALGVTHVANGAYRLHPTEWNTGESAGRLASFCLARGLRPAEVLDQPRRLREFQIELLQGGVPIHWFVDLRDGEPLFVAAQALAVWQQCEFDHARLELSASPERHAGLLARFEELRGR